MSDPERVASAFAREECTTLAAVAELTPAVFDKLVASMDMRALSESRLRKLVEDARTPVSIGIVIDGLDDVESATPAPAPATVVLTGPPPAPGAAASVEAGTRTRWVRGPGGGWVRQVVAAVAKSDFTSPVGTRWAIKGGDGASGGGGNAGAGSSTRRLTLERTPDARAPGEAGGRRPGDQMVLMDTQAEGEAGGVHPLPAMSLLPRFPGLCNIGGDRNLQHGRVRYYPAVRRGPF